MNYTSEILNEWFRERFPDAAAGLRERVWWGGWHWFSGVNNLTVSNETVPLATTDALERWGECQRFKVISNTIPDFRLWVRRTAIKRRDMDEHRLVTSAGAIEDNPHSFASRNRFARLGVSDARTAGTDPPGVKVQ